LDRIWAKKDFFWTKKYSTAHLDIISIVSDTVTAELTIKEITHPIHFPIDYQHRGSTIVTSGSMTIDRTLYGIKYNSNSYFQDLGNYAIKNEFDLNFEIFFEEK